LVAFPNRGRASPALGQLGDVSRLTGKLRAVTGERSEGAGSLLGLDMGLPGRLAIDIFVYPSAHRSPIPSGTVGVVPLLQLQLQGLVSCTPVLLKSWHRAPTLTRDARTHSAELDFGGGSADISLEASPSLPARLQSRIAFGLLASLGAPGRVSAAAGAGDRERERDLRMPRGRRALLDVRRPEGLLPDGTG
jgi:hypothetical protein